MIGFTIVLGLGCSRSGSETTERRDAARSGDTAHVEQALAQIVATLGETSGVVEVRRKGQPQWEAVGVGALLRERDWVRTGPGGFARLRFGARGSLDLRADTTILVDSKITVEAGSVVGVAKATDGAFIVRTADGSEAKITAAPGGGATEFRLTPSAGSGLEIAVTKGSAEVTTRAGLTTISAGEATDVANHSAGKVITLIAFPKSSSPGVDARFLFRSGMRIPLLWAPVPQADRYYVQVARDTDFRTMLFTVETTTPSTSFSADAEGVYAWRVASRDASGRLGEFGFARRIYLEKDEPKDLLLAPADGVKIGFSGIPPAIDFSWRTAGDTNVYTLVIFRTLAPNSEPVVSMTTSSQHLVVTTLDEGSYSWGVYGVRQDRVDPLFLKFRQLTIRRQQGPKVQTKDLWNETAP